MNRLTTLFLTLFPLAAFAQTDAQPLGCADESWGAYISPGPQEFERREVISLDENRDIIVIEFGALEGEFAKLFIFLEDNGACFTRAVSVGSYAFTNMFAAESGQDRVYHIDLYEYESHSTLDMRDTPPSYAEARAIALRVLQ